MRGASFAVGKLRSLRRNSIEVMGWPPFEPQGYCSAHDALLAAACHPPKGCEARFRPSAGGERSSVEDFRKAARGRSAGTPGRLLLGVGLIVAAAVVVLIVLLYGIQSVV
jgi:hypothetical protein